MNEPQTGRLWIRLVKKHRIAKDVLVPCTRETPQEALREALPRFRPEHFVDAVWFDSMEISYVYPEDEKKQARRRSVLEDV